MGRWSLTEKKFQITILGLSHKVCCLLPSTSYCKMVRFTADSFPVDSQSALIFNEVSAVKGRAWHTCDPNTDVWERVRLYDQVIPTLPLRLVFFRVVFTCGLFSFFPLVSMTLWHRSASLWTAKIQRAKETKTRRPKVISPAVMSPEIKN